MGLKVDRHTPLTRAHYTVAYHKCFDPPVEPRYVVNIDVPPAHRPAVAPDQLRSRHGAPAVSLSLNDVRRITGWTPSPMPRPVVTVRLLRELLAHTKTSSPYHDGITYSILSCLSDDMLEIVVHIINACFTTGNPHDIPAAEFYALHTKPPHFFMATCRPILNMATLWKLLTLTGSHFIVRHIVSQGTTPPCQFAQYPHSSSADVSRVLHDTVLHWWETTGEFWMVSDDVVHAYGSMGHTNVLNTLLVGGVFPLWQN